MIAQLHLVFIILFLVLAGTSLKPEWGWLFDLTSHFRIFWIFSLALLTLVMALFNFWVYALASLLLLGLITFSLRDFTKSSNIAECDGDVRLVLFNVRMRNRRYDRAYKFLLDRNPDLIALVEVDEAWLDALSALKTDYPYAAVLPHPNSYGLALFSRFEILDWKGSRLEGSEFNHLEALVDVNDMALTMVIAHLPPPFNPREMAKRDTRLAQLGHLMSGLDGPGLLMGDFNASPWSPQVLELEKKYGVRSFQKECGLASTWPAQVPFGRIPIDHVLAFGNSVEFCQAEVGPKLGSDHLPVAINFEFKNNQAY